MMHTFCSLNDVTIKLNYSMQRIESVLKAVAQLYIKYVFSADTSNEY